MRQTLREYVELATGLAEEAGKRVVGTAAELLERAGVDLEAAERTVSAQLPQAVQSLQTLAQELVTVGRGGLDLAVGLARAEAEKAAERFGKVGDQVVKVGVVFSYLEGKLRDLEGEGGAAERNAGLESRPTPPAGRADSLFGEDWQPEQEWDSAPGVISDHEPELHLAEELDEDLEGTLEWAPTPATEPVPKPRPAAAKKTAAKKATAQKPAAAKDAPATKAPAKKAPAKAAAKKATVAENAAKKSTTNEAATKKAAEKETTAKKSAPAPKAEAGERDV